MRHVVLTRLPKCSSGGGMHASFMHAYAIRLANRGVETPRLGQRLYKDKEGGQDNSRRKEDTLSWR